MFFITLSQIEEHRRTLDRDNPRDVIDGYLIERGDDPELTDEVFACNLIMLFPDAIDSTGCLFEFLVFYLAYYPDWQRKVRARVDAEFTEDKRVCLMRCK